MEKKNLKMLIWVIVALAVVVVAIALYFTLANKQPVEQVTTDNSAIKEKEPESVQDVGTKDTGAGAASISYADALVKYADRRIQLDTSCQAHPNTVTYKDNTGIMIDNRSPNTRTVKINTTFTIKPWGFKIIVLPDVTSKPKTILVDCDSSQNVATILVQE